MRWRGRTPWLSLFDLGNHGWFDLIVSRPRIFPVVRVHSRMQPTILWLSNRRMVWQPFKRNIALGVPVADIVILSVEQDLRPPCQPIAILGTTAETPDRLSASIRPPGHIAHRPGLLDTAIDSSILANKDYRESHVSDGIEHSMRRQRRREGPAAEAAGARSRRR